MSHGATAASTSPRMGGRKAPVCHVASLREPATRALPAAKQTECGTSLCLDGPYLDSVLVLPRVSPSRFLQTLKGYTAREANRLLGRTGQPFWQAESYDHAVRDDRESDRIKGYIENNPVKAGLVANAEDYLWSSADRDRGK